MVKNYTVKKDVNNAKIKNNEDKIPDVTNLVTNTTLNAKINEVKNKIPNITNLATTTAFTAVENKIPNVSNLVKKTDKDTKISDTENKITSNYDHDKNIATQEFDNVHLVYAYLASKSCIANFVNKTNLNKNELNDLKAISKNRINKRFDK